MRKNTNNRFRKFYIALNQILDNLKSNKKQKKEMMMWLATVSFMFLALYVLSAFSSLLKNRLTNSFTQNIDLLNRFFGVNEFHVIYLILVFVTILMLWVLKKKE